MKNNGNNNFNNQQNNGPQQFNNGNQFNGNMPPQGYYQKPKKPWYVRWYMIVIYVFIGLGVIGSIGSQNKKDDTSTTSSGSSNSDTKDTAKTEEKKEEIKDTYAIGEEVTLDKHTLKVNSVQRTQGDKYIKAKDGKEYVIINVTITNSGTNTASYNPYDFKMQNSQGNITDCDFTDSNSGDRLDSGELAAGGTVTGTIAFEQPVGDKGLILKYKSNLFSNKEIKVKIDQ